MNKPLHVTIDFNDDVESAGGWYARRHVEQSMARLAELGVSRVYWISHHDAILHDRLRDDDRRGSLTRAVVEAAHAQGLEVWGLFKPFEMGLCLAVPHAIPLPEDAPSVTSSAGRHPLVEPFVLDHPEMRLRRRCMENARRRPGAIKLVKADAQPTRLRADALEIWTSPVNGAFRRYDGPVEFDGGVEQRDGGARRVLTLGALDLPADTGYILVRCTAPSAAPDFVSDHARIMEVRDRRGRPMATRHDVAAMRLDGAGPLDGFARTLRVLGLWQYGDPGRYLAMAPADYGHDAATTGYAFAGDWPGPGGRRALDGDPARDPLDGFAVRTLVQNEYLWGALHPCYPEVRTHWLGRIRALMDAGMDGVDVRICNHSSWAVDGDQYGFNEPAVAAFRERHGVDTRTEDFDLAAWKTHLHEYWMMFQREARDLVRSRGLALQLHVPAHLGGEGRAPLNNVPSCFGWDWRRWIAEPGLCDAIHLKWPQLDMAFAGEVAAFARAHGKEVTFSLRLQYRKMDGTQNDELRERLQWAERNEYVDAIVLYEKDCFTDLDHERDEVVVLPAIRELLSPGGS